METAKTLHLYVNYILSFFERMNCGVGQGLFLLRTINSALYRQHSSQTEMEIIHRMVFNLYLNQFIETDDEYYFFKLAHKGFQYIQGAKDIHIKPCLPNIVNCTKDHKKFFDDLWLMIGLEGEAPFYVGDEVLYTILSSFISSQPTYSSFIKERAQRGESINRVVWLESLLSDLPKEKWQEFLEKLSDTIEQEYYPKITHMEMSGEIFQVESKRNDQKKKVFISYTHEDDAYNAWVKKLAEDLEKRLQIVIDYKLDLGKQWTQFMEESIKSSDKVLLILTPTYKEKADCRTGGAGYETTIITQELWTSTEDKVKFIPIIRKGTFKESYPTYLGSANGLDMTDNNSYETNLSRLIEQLEKEINR